MKSSRNEALKQLVGRGAASLAADGMGCAMGADGMTVRTTERKT
jgi:hypothetical protein